jgi:transcriptional regulator with XRE-family HTH domain
MVKRWAPLPGSLTAAHAALVGELRQLKDQSGLSLSRLAAQTNYSRSSWERWLNGKRPIPQVAVESIAKSCDADPARLIDLYRAAASGLPDATAQPVLPRQLPCAPRHFVGRADTLRELADVIARRTGTYGGTTVLVLDGIAGIGKTALAIRWAHEVAGYFPDGQLYLNLRGFDPTNSPITPGEAVRGFLSAFQVAPDAVPADLDAQAALYRSLLSDKRILLVLDNARDAEQVRPLLPGSATCLTVVTSRTRLTGLAAVEGAHLLSLPLLSDCEAHELLTAHIGLDQASTQAAAVRELIARCAGLPLALSIVGARSAAQPSFPLAAIADELGDANTLMNALNSGDAIADVRTVFSSSYRYLSPDAARTFRLLSAHPGPDISIPAAASMLGIPADEARQALSELTQANLLDEHAPGRFAFHTLLRAYAAEQASFIDSGTERQDATHRVLDHYLHTASGAALQLAPARPATSTPPAPHGNEPSASSTNCTIPLPRTHVPAYAGIYPDHPCLIPSGNQTLNRNSTTSPSAMT